MHIGVCVCKFKLFISDDKDNTIENVDLCLFLALHRHIVASLAARSSSVEWGGCFGLPPLRSSLAWLLVRSWGWWMAAPLLVGWHYYSSSRRLSANASKVVGKCQQGCQQMSTTWPTNASNPKLKFVKPLASCFPPPLASELCIKGVVPSPRHPFFSSKYEKSGANIWLYGKNYVPLQSQLRNGAFCNEVKRIPSHRGVEQLVARQAHNLEVARSNPASATTNDVM